MRLYTCQDVAELAPADAADLTPSQRLRMRLHLAICAACRLYLDQVRRTRALLFGRAIATDDDTVEAVVARALEGRPPPPG